ncbi:MAG: 30S ribosomal protein S20 [Candidatus Nealsonbacteria bacterium]|nr:30S ribosomal protein S20 [Candidatus Nealsonbacteria bacterium]
MPITESAKKALRQSRKRRKQNQRVKEDIKKLEKTIESLLAQKKTSEAKNLLPQIARALDKAAKIGVIKKNKASRKKSRIGRRLNRPAAAPENKK